MGKLQIESQRACCAMPAENIFHVGQVDKKANTSPAKARELI